MTAVHVNNNGLFTLANTENSGFMISCLVLLIQFLILISFASMFAFSRLDAGLSDLPQRVAKV